MTPGELDDAVQAAAAAALAALGGHPADAAGRAGVRRPRHPEQGDYASPVALQLAKATGLPAGELARAVAAELGRYPGVRRAEVAGPGFVSIWLTTQASGDLAGVIVAGGEAYGHSDRLAGKRFQLDPPPGDPPLTATLSQARRAALAAATGRLLLAAGAELFKAADAELTEPAGAELTQRAGTAQTEPAGTALAEPAGAELTQRAGTAQTEPAGTALAEPAGAELAEPAGAELAETPGPGVTSLRIPGPAATRASASSQHLIGPSVTRDPRNTVSARTESSPGPSPTGLPVAQGGQDTSSAEAPSAALVPGTLGQLVAAVGVGTARYALVSWPPGAAVEIDLAVWARRTSASPAWVVRHAPQRINGLEGRVAAAGISLESGYEPGRLTAREETALLSLLAEFPAVIAIAGRTGEPHRVARYLESVAAAWSACDEACPVLPRRGQPEPDLARARLTLAQAAGTVLASGLRLLGVPD